MPVPCVVVECVHIHIFALYPTFRQHCGVQHAAIDRGSYTERETRLWSRGAALSFGARYGTKGTVSIHCIQITVVWIHDSCFFLNECDRAHFAHFSFCPLIEYALFFRFPYLRVELNWQHFIVSVLIYTKCLTIRVRKNCPKACVYLFSFTAFRPPCPPWTLKCSVLLSLWHRCHF